MTSLGAKIKNVLSGDTVVLVPAKSSQVPVPERVLTLQYVRGDTYTAKEYLRQLAIGKEIKFRVLFKLPTSGKEFGDISSPVFSSLTAHLLEKGMVKLKDHVRGETEAEEQHLETLKEAQERGRLAGAGVWSADFSDPTVIALGPEISAQSQTQPLTTVVEKVVSGDRVFARLLVDAATHVLLPLILAGVKSPRTDDEDSTTRIVAFQAKQYVEDRLLTSKQNVAVRIIGENQAGLPLAIIEHPSGNSIHEKLLENGLAEIVDWQSSLVGAATMSTWRKAEQTAKSLARGLWASKSRPEAPRTAVGAGSAASKLQVGASLDVVVSKIINADTFNVRLPNGTETTVQLASIRAPRPNDTTVTKNSLHQQALVQMAREFTRTSTIGRTAKLYVDAWRPANPDLGLEARFLVSLNVNGDLSEKLVTRGLASVIKHNKQTASERSLNWDKLVEIEEEQKKEGKHGIFYKGDIAKILTLGSRVVNASELAAKAKTFFNTFSKKGRISGGYYVEYVVSANRVRLYNPKEGIKLLLILGGLSNDRALESGSKGLDYLNRKYLQRAVEFEVYDTDKVGGFIGNLYSSDKALKPVQVELLELGLASIHEIAILYNKHGAEFEKAEAEAQKNKLGIWQNYDAAAAKSQEEELAKSFAELQTKQLTPEFIDIEVVDIDPTGVILFHRKDTATSAKFTRFKVEFNDFNAQNVSASQASVDLPTSLARAPKKGEYVSAKFDENGKFYRARVVSHDRAANVFEVKHVDFGNIDKVQFSALRTLPKQFGVDTIKPFAETCALQNIKLPPTKPNDYLTEAIYVLEELLFDKRLVLSVLKLSKIADYGAIIYDSDKSVKDTSYTINRELISQGFGIVDEKAPVYNREYVDDLLKKQKEAKALRVGCWELGDITEEDD